MKKLTLSTEHGIRESLTNLYYGNECSVQRIMDAAEDSRTGKELERRINSLKLFETFRLDRETAEYARLEGTDCFGNRHYLKAWK